MKIIVSAHSELSKLFAQNGLGQVREFEIPDGEWRRLFAEAERQHREENYEQLFVRVCYRWAGTRLRQEPAREPRALTAREFRWWAVVGLVLLLVQIVLSARAEAQMRDYAVTFKFTAAGRSTVFDNRDKACTSWHLVYFNSGFSTLSLELDFAADNNGSPGSWNVWTDLPAGTALPLTSAVSGQATAYRYKPWVSVNLNSVSGSGTISGSLVCRAPFANNDISSTGGGGSTVTANQGAANSAANGWPVKVTDGVDTANVTGASLDVNCTGGCTPGGSFADNSAFSFGTTPIGVAGYVFDDTAPNAATENSAAAPRMSSNRVPYVEIRDGAGGERGANVNASSQLEVAVGNTPTVALGQTGAQNDVDIASFPANTPFNLAQYGGTGVVNGGVAGLPAVGGNVASDAVDAGNPVKIGGRAETTSITRVADGDRVDATFDTDGVQFVRSDHPQRWHYHENSSSALTDTQVQAAPGAGVCVFVQTVVASTGAATAWNMFLEEGTTTTILGPWYLEAVAGRGFAFNFIPPRKVTANTSLTVTTSAAIAHSIDITGFTGSC